MTNATLKSVEVQKRSTSRIDFHPMASESKPGLRILLTSSLAQSSLNNHILNGVLAAFSAHSAVESVRYIPPQDVTRLPNFGDDNLLIYIGSAVSEAIPHYMLASMARKTKMRSVFWATDDPYEFDFRYRANLYDLYISNDLNASRNLLDRENVYHIPLAAQPADKRVITPHEQRARGIFFCGYPFANRKQIVDEILNLDTLSNSDMVISGPKWDHIPNGVIASPTSHEALINIYAGSEFVLNMGRSFNVANEHYNLVASTPGPRTFECALAGTPQLFFGNETEIQSFFVPDEEILICESVEDLERHVKALRADPDRWESVACKAQERAYRDHLFMNRADDLIKIIQKCGVITKTYHQVEKLMGMEAA